MPDWAAFAAATVSLTAALLFFARRSRRTLDRVRIVDDDDVSPDGTTSTDETTPTGGATPNPSDYGGVAPGPHPIEGSGSDRTAGPERPGDGGSHDPALTTTFLLANVTVSQGAALIALVAIAWVTDVPASAFGLGIGWGIAAVGLGVVAGGVLYAGNEVAVRLADRVGTTASERLREAMAPTGVRGWILLFGLTLPTIAAFEEALFRGALIGALAVGFGVNPWILAAGSSIVFGLGHGAQGRLGVVVTGLLGVALAALFVRTGSLLVVIVAHYVVNVLEFLVREGYDPIATARSGTPR